MAEFSSTISMDHNELSRHTRVVGKQRRAAMKVLRKLKKEHAACYG